MNDSFLEDLELVEPKPSARPVDRHVTTRAASSPLQHLPEIRAESLPQKTDRRTPTIVESRQKEPQHRKTPDKDSKKQTIKIKVPEKKERSVENRLRPVENRVRLDPKDEQRSLKTPEFRHRTTEPKSLDKERTRRSVDQKEKENALSADLSSKENRPSDSSRESKSPVETSKDRVRKCDCSKHTTPKDKDPVALLNAIKDLISTYTKQESTKILRAMQELHLNSQANLIKNFISQTDDLIKEMHPSKDSMRVRALVEQNERLQEDILTLQRRNEELRKRLEEFEFVKEENVNLKLKCMELSKQP